MKTKTVIAICTIGCIVTFLITGVFSSFSDGNNTIGFPFTFYQYLGGKRFPEPESRHHFNALLLVADLLIVSVVSVSVGFIFKKMRRPN